MKKFEVQNVVELAGEILPPWVVAVDSRIIAYCAEEADARLIADACNDAEQEHEPPLTEEERAAITIAGHQESRKDWGAPVMLCNHNHAVSPRGHAVDDGPSSFDIIEPRFLTSPT